MSNVGVDWGSSSFRAYRFDESNQIADVLHADTGIKSVGDRTFEKLLFDNIGHWLDAGDHILFSGMITSRNGWYETPYLETPIALDQLLARAVVQQLPNRVTGHFLPGICMREPRGDVMRGEELQLYGSIASLDSPPQDQVVVLPGTHSKWALITSGVLDAFHTTITGEMFDLLLNHSLLGTLSESDHSGSDQWAQAAFLDGVTIGYEESNIITQLFSARSSVLLQSITPTDVKSYLSGLLIGNEIREAKSLIDVSSLLLVGESSLVQKYHSALTSLSIHSEIMEGEAAARGFQQLLQQQVRV